MIEDVHANELDHAHNFRLGDLRLEIHARSLKLIDFIQIEK